jgi:hypothetical protein
VYQDGETGPPARHLVVLDDGVRTTASAPATLDLLAGSMAGGRTTTAAFISTTTGGPETPWATTLLTSAARVRQYIRDNALMWLGLPLRRPAGRCHYLHP